MQINKEFSITFIVLSLIVIIILIYLLVKCKDKSEYKNEKFCNCRQMLQKVCPDTHNLTNLYESGKLTENSDFSKMEKVKNSKEGAKWLDVMPSDIFEAQIQNKPIYSIPF